MEGGLAAFQGSQRHMAGTWGQRWTGACERPSTRRTSGEVYLTLTCWLYWDGRVGGSDPDDATPSAM
jgi:hypothetical protein